ncbi:SGNH/GDSL hydrolase family protein [Tenacibaculum agarivorans]|uniref:SGNH/GDSL hydrolase family protein n=1 Tax=Tenacibaculum agarivorans TaxID=1908389 RepID=UPI00094BC1AC|nr:SGNH/GDSL hydrolase family protein [Tenacibaculum agarivorans]
MNKYIFIIICLVTLVGCTRVKEQVILHTNSEIEYWGRINFSEREGAKLYWSGTSIKMNFKGTSVKALLKDSKGDNYYNVIIDNEVTQIIRPDTTKQYYQLASNLPEGKHTVELFKRTEWDRGVSTFYGFKIDKGGKALPKSSSKKRTIEFYGNSITAGYAVDDIEDRDRPDSIFTNHYKSYAAITARHFDAKFHAICKSGIGITISWFPLTMPELYDRLIPDQPNSRWDFSKYKPDVVVVNLFQNDSWLVDMLNREEFKAIFGNKPPEDDYLITSYEKFIIKLRQHYPETYIICMLGNMDATELESKWPGLVSKAVANLKDDKIYTHFVPYKNTPNHPTEKEQREIAKSLIHFIENTIIW